MIYKEMDLIVRAFHSDVLLTEVISLFTNTLIFLVSLFELMLNAPINSYVQVGTLPHFLEMFIQN